MDCVHVNPFVRPYPAHPVCAVLPGPSSVLGPASTTTRICIMCANDASGRGLGCCHLPQVPSVLRLPFPPQSSCCDPTPPVSHRDRGSGMLPSSTSSVVLSFAFHFPCGVQAALTDPVSHRDWGSGCCHLPQLRFLL